MGLVGDETVSPGQDLAEAFVPEREIGTQQVMIDDHHIRFLGTAPRLHQVASAPFRTALAETIVAAGGHRRPHGSIFRQVELSHVPAPGDRGPIAHLEQLLAQLDEPAPMVLQGHIEPVAAQIVRPPLEHGDADRDVQNLAHQGKVAVEKLILEVSGAGGDQDLATGKQGRNKIGKGLAGAGTGLADEAPAFYQELRHRLRHGLLLGTVIVAFQALS